MIPGVTAIGVYGVSVLPSEYDQSEQDSLITLLQAPLSRKRIYLLEASPYDRTTAAVIAARASNSGYSTTAEDTLVSKEFPGRLITPYNMQVSVFSGGRLAAHSIPGFGEIRLANPDGGIDPWKRYAWGERQLTVKAGLSDFTYDEFGIIFTGTCERVSWKWREIGIHLRDYQYKLAKPIQTNLYAGTGGLEGGSELKGKPKPICLGQVRQIEPVAVDPDFDIWQYHDGTVQGSSNWADGGVALTDAGDVADLYAVSVSAGQYKTDHVKGLIRVGSTPTSILTGDVQGDKTGGVYVSSAPNIIRRILNTRASVIDDEIDLGSITIADSANDSIHGYYIRLDRVNIDSVIDDLASSIGAFWTYTRSGLFRLVILTEPGTPVKVLTQDDFTYDSITSQPIPPPSKLLRLGHHRYWRTQEGTSLSDDPAEVTPEERAQFGAEYRYVTSPNPDATIATSYLDAEESESLSLFDVEADAQAESDRRIALHGVPREILTVPLVIGLFNYQLGDSLEFAPDVDRYDLAGWKGVIVGMVEDVGDGTGPGSIVVHLWGSALGVGIVDDEGDFLVDDEGNIIVA